MPAARRRSMAEFPEQQRALEEPSADAAGTPAPAPAAAPTVISARSLPAPSGGGRNTAEGGRGREELQVSAT